MTEARSAPGSLLLEPIVLIALALWLLNDHYLKAAYGNAFTGKLSDVASLVVFPLLPLTVHEWLQGRASRSAVVFWVLATCSVMASINIFEVAADAYRIGLGAAQWPFMALRQLLAGRSLPALHTVRLWMDPTDLWTLPSALVPLRLAWLRAAQPAQAT